MTNVALASTGALEQEPGFLQSARAAIRARSKGEPAWLEARRTESAAFLESTGFPRQKDEAWRFTPTRDVTRVPYAFATAELQATARHAEGVEICRLSEVLTSAPDRLEPYLGRIATIEDGFSALNGALWQDGIVVFAASGARSRIEIANLVATHAEPAFVLPRVLVVADRGSELVIVDCHSPARPLEGFAGGRGAHFSASVTELVLAEGARVEHVRIQDGTQATASVSTISVRQDRNSHYTSRVFTFGGTLSRLDLRVALAAEGAECVLDGLYVAREGELIDHHTTIDHERPHCQSRERYKGALDGTGTAIFDGSIIVRHGALRTEAHQENRNLLLSENSVVHTKPELRIDADDVKCSHGATVGRLDPAQLFYLRSRGIDTDVARSVLAYAFLREMTEAAPEDLRSGLEDRILALFPAGAIVKELA